MIKDILDIVLPKYHTMIFVHGCFWHMHESCRYFVMPSSNVEFWSKKLNRNKERDAREKTELEEAGWKVLTIWECQLKKDYREKTLQNLYCTITEHHSKRIKD